MSEDYYSVRNNAARFEFDSIADDKGVSYAKLKGLTGEEFERVIRVQQHGITSHPPQGAHGIGIALGNKRDALMVLGGEHPQHRPKNIGAGNTALYNADGSIMKLIGQDMTIDAKGNATINVKTITFKTGGCTMKLTGDGLEITGGTVKHDGVKIGKDHLHENAGGSGLSGPPQS